MCLPYQAFVWDSWGTCGIHRQQPAHSLVITPLPAGWSHGWIRKRFSWLPQEQWVGREPSNLQQPTGNRELLNSQRVSHAHYVQAMQSLLPGSLHLERHSPKEAGRALPSWRTASFTDSGTSENTETGKTGIAPEVFLLITLTHLFVDFQSIQFLKIFSRIPTYQVVDHLTQFVLNSPVSWLQS